MKWVSGTLNTGFIHVNYTKHYTNDRAICIFRSFMTYIVNWTHYLCNNEHEAQQSHFSPSKLATYPPPLKLAFYSTCSIVQLPDILPHISRTSEMQQLCYLHQNHFQVEDQYIRKFSLIVLFTSWGCKRFPSWFFSWNYSSLPHHFSIRCIITISTFTMDVTMFCFCNQWTRRICLASGLWSATHIIRWF